MQNQEQDKNIENYWRANLKLVGSLLLIWWLVSYGAGILFADTLNQIRLGGFPLGFWFAQQGSIFVFVGLIYFYAYIMRQLDKKYDLEDESGDIQ